MTKLINDYREIPSYILARKIRAYASKHPMAACMLTREDADLLADAIHHANTGPVGASRQLTRLLTR